MLTILSGIVWLVAFAWLVTILLTLYGLARQKPLLPSGDLPVMPIDAPLVSILVPARNEQHRVLENCIQSILAQDYEHFEVIAVNDRSTDETEAILQALAREDERLRVIKGQEPPAGWLGKPYAMQQACNHARGEWILATDADMIFEKSVLRIAMDRTLAGKGDALTLIPHFEALSFWERVMIPTWLWVFLMFAVFYRISNPSTRGAVGIGGFFLMRRSVLERIGGYEALKDEVMEDVRLQQALVLAMVSKYSEVSPVYALTAPLGLGLLYAMLFDSSIRITTGKGVTWKGRRIYERRGVAQRDSATSRLPFPTSNNKEGEKLD